MNKSLTEQAAGIIKEIKTNLGMLILTSNSYSVTQSFIKNLPKKPSELKLTFIPTAAEAEEGDLSWLNQDKESLVNVGFEVQEFSLTNKTKEEVREMLDNTNVVFVSGGNTFYLLQEMRKSGFTELIAEYIKKGIIYIGSSAGSVVAGPDISLVKDLDDAKAAPELTDYAGLNLIDIVVLPHWGSDHFREHYSNAMKSNYKIGNKIILLTDEQYLLVDTGGYSIEV